MNETNETTVETSEEWRELPTVLCQPPKFEGLEQRDSFYQAGDYWVSFVETAAVEHHAHVDSDAAKLHAVRGVSDYLLGGWDAWYGRLQPCGDAAYTFNVGELPNKFVQVLDAMRYAVTEGTSIGDYFVPEDADSLCSKLETNTGYKVHKQARALYLKHLQGNTQRNTRGDYGTYYEAGAVRMLAKLHGLVVNRFAVPIGLGFEDGNPLVILAEPVCRDGHRVDSFRTKSMRLGKWLQSVWGRAKDIRPLVEDVKVLNKPSTTYLCTTEQEWYDAYEGGQSSCMTGNNFEYSPVRCYASTSHGLPDNGLRLFIQYVGELFGDNFEVQVRAIVNVNSKTYVRAYGTAADAVLRAAGYERDGDCLDGCVLARIPYPGDSACVLMPYLDGDNDYVDEHTVAGVDCFVVTGDGEYQALEADGYIYLEGGEECVCCGSRISYHDDSYGTNDGTVGDCCIDEYLVPLGRIDRYHKHQLSWSEWHDAWVHESDIAECAIQGLVHDNCDMTEAQGHLVLDRYVEPDNNGNYILTLEACEILGEDYLGGIDEDEQEEAA
ncbi:MAG: hypothetical protein [Bacteriophage sp.]|nr:MAG: hypothetical protein [Bacteriophage sp.]